MHSNSTARAPRASHRFALVAAAALVAPACSAPDTSPYDATLPDAAAPSDASASRPDGAPAPDVAPAPDDATDDAAPDAVPVRVIDGCQVPDPAHLDRFVPCPTGGGIYGRWAVDDEAAGLPAFEYALDEVADPRAVWPNSEAIAPLNRVRRDHFAVLGNDRVNFLAVDDGYVTLYSNERAPTWLNRFDEAARNLGGGFSFVRDGALAYATAFRYAPERARAARVFGMGYFRTESVVGALRVRHTVRAPAGDAPLLIDEVELENLGDAPRAIAHYEYWDVNRHQLLSEWVRTGLGAAPSDQGRDNFNARFTQQVTWDAAARVLTASMQPNPGERPPAPDAPSREDFYPAPVFLAALDGDGPADVAAVYGDQRAFFGSGTPAQPAAVAAATPPASQLLAPGTGALGQPACLVMRTDLALAPHAPRRLRFAYGYAPRTGGAAVTPQALAARFRAPPAGGSELLAHGRAWRDRLVYAYVPAAPWMHREAAWHAQQLLGHSVYNEYYGTTYTPQGSAYLYLHGADGVPRDQALFTLALDYVDPGLARGNLNLIMALQHAADGALPYSFTNFATHEGATIHDDPSDLDLYFLLAVGEYLAVTGDTSLLDERVPFFPRDATARPPGASGDTGLDHVRAAFVHLRDRVGLGAHGLVRIHQGDWSDGIVYEDPSPLAIANTTARGESVPNSQIAVYALPRLAQQLAGRDASLAGAIDRYATALRAPVQAAFGAQWSTRAWLLDSLGRAYAKGNDLASDPFRANYLDLESQPWALLADALLAPGQRRATIDAVRTQLDDPAPNGPVLRAGGMVWPAISQLMTWAYARTDGALAWRSLERQSLYTHATRWPAVWTGVWSAPDGLNSSDGQAWVSPVTPMTDFPVANMNWDAMWLLGLVRAAGVEPAASGDGVVIAPAWGGGRDTYVIDAPLVRVDVAPGHIAGVYRARNAGRINLHLALPPDVTPSRASVTLDGRAVAPTVDADGRLVLPLAFARGDQRAFEARW